MPRKTLATMQQGVTEDFFLNSIGFLGDIKLVDYNNLKRAYKCCTGGHEEYALPSLPTGRGEKQRDCMGSSVGGDVYLESSGNCECRVNCKPELVGAGTPQ